MNDLGLKSQILRRDYLYGSLLAEGSISFETSPAELLQQRSPGPISEQDYLVAKSLAKDDVVRVNGQTTTSPEDSAEVYDVVVIGAGLSGLAAAYYVQQNANNSARLLIIENHEDCGGNARRDEFQIDGRLQYAPQGSTVIQDLSPALAPSDQALYLFSELGIDLSKHRVPEDQYWFGVFRDGNGNPAWYANFLAVPMDDSTKASLGAFFETVMQFYDGDWQAKLKELDKVTFREYVRQRGWTDEFFQLMQPQLGAFFGFPDAVSAACVYAHYGTKSPRYIYAFPGGNSGLARYLVKALIPNAIDGNSADGILSAPLRKEYLDRAENPTRLRLNCPAIRIEHDGDPQKSSQVLIAVRTDEKFRRLRARTVIMACGGFVTRRIVADLPESHRDAFDQFVYSPVLWANVALRNSRALDKAGLTLLSSYSEGFGGVLLRYENIKPHSASPERPTVLGVACPRFYPGKDAREQERLARHELVSTPFREYEKSVRQDLMRVLGPWGFDPAQDIAAIVLHRWAQHTYVFGYPGFFTSGIVEKAKQPFGRIAFAHTDLHKFSLVMGAVEQGRRAAEEVCEQLALHAGATH